MIQVDVLILAFVAGSLIPFATGILTKVRAHSGLKAFVSAALSALTAVVAYLTEFAGAGNVKIAVLLFASTWITHAGAYLGFWRPTGLAEKVQESTDPVGIG